MTAFDPYAIQPDWSGQGGQAVDAWQRANARLNLQKNNTMQKYGFNQNTGDLGGNVTYNTDGTVKNVTETGGMTGVSDISGMAALDNKSGQGGFRDELNTESNMLNSADSGPSRGFTGGLANQAKDLAQKAVASRQSQFTQNYNQFAAGQNQAGTDAAGSTNTGLFNILDQQTQWSGNQAAFQATQPVGISGGGSTPIVPAGVPIPQTAYTRTGPETPGPARATGKSSIPGAFGGLGHIT